MDRIAFGKGTLGFPSTLARLSADGPAGGDRAIQATFAAAYEQSRRNVHRIGRGGGIGCGAGSVAPRGGVWGCGERREWGRIVAECGRGADFADESRSGGES